jgi:hypothetical protein
MNRQEIAAFLKKYQAVYPNTKLGNDPGEVINVWEEFLGNIPAEVVNACFSLYVAEGHPFGPNVGELIQMGMRVSQRQKEDMTAAQAWSLVSKALQNGIYGAEKEFAALPERVQRCVGSPEQLRNMATDPSYNEGVQKGIFLKQYEAELRRERDVAALPGAYRDLVLGVSERIGIDEIQ